jgi:hypothetical protein
MNSFHKLADIFLPPTVADEVQQTTFPLTRKANLWERLKRYREIHAMHGNTRWRYYILSRAGIPNV